MKKYIAITVAGAVGLFISLTSFGLMRSEAGIYDDNIVSEASFTAPVTHENEPTTPSEDAGYETTFVSSEIITRATTERPVSTTRTTTTVTTETTTTEAITTVPVIPQIAADNLTAEAFSVSCIKVRWDKEEGREYEVTVDTDAGYTENIFILFNEEGCYLTGLRENSSYQITVTPKATEGEDAELISNTIECRTYSVEVIQEFPHEEGWTNCFAGERASGLTAMPSSGAIADSFMDEITDTTIRCKANGDYCCAMGQFYGEVGDRFLIELDNGIQFTVQICDSKGWADDADADIDGDGIMEYYIDEEGNTYPAGDGVPDGRFHWFAHGAGKCVVEFIYDSDANLPSCVRFSGSWGGYCWNGLNLCANINSIKKINY